MKKIILTGGGTAGHVTPNLALIPELTRRGYEIKYIGSYDGMEKGLVELAGLPYFGISAGKLRRYFSWKNFSDPFRVVKGFFEARKILKKEHPDVIFSKGGFVSAPVVYAAKTLHIPSVIHESDMTPGLANKLCFPAAGRILCNFPETLKNLPAKKAKVSGCPIREELLSGSREEGLRFTGLSGNKPILMAMGGSLGSVALNTCLRSILPELLKEFDVIHLCGRGHLEEGLIQPGYVQYEYISKEMKDLFAIADFMISRAGANAICEILALQKPNLLVPLPLSASRGDQILNAKSFSKQGFSMMLEEENITDETLLTSLHELYDKRSLFRKTMAESHQADAVSFVADQLDALCR